MKGKGYSKEDYYDAPQQQVAYDPKAELLTHTEVPHDDGIVLDMFGFKLEVSSWEGVGMLTAVIFVLTMGGVMYKKLTGQLFPFQKPVVGIIANTLGKKKK
jgi:hypothetical protein